MTESTPTSASIVLVHGLWMTPLSWEKWIKHFSTKGHTAIAPGWPGVELDHSSDKFQIQPWALRHTGRWLIELVFVLRYAIAYGI